MVGELFQIALNMTGGKGGGVTCENGIYIIPGQQSTVVTAGHTRLVG